MDDNVRSWQRDLHDHVERHSVAPVPAWAGNRHFTVDDPRVELLQALGLELDRAFQILVQLNALSADPDGKTRI